MLLPKVPAATPEVGRDLSRGGRFDAEAVRKAALDVDVRLGGALQGYGVKFAPPEDVMAGQNVRALPVVMQNRGRNITVVWPSQISTAEAVLPLPAFSPYSMRG